MELNLITHYQLQWGHRFTSVETGVDHKPGVVRAGASMGPPIYIGGNSWGGRLPRIFNSSFNGATDLHRWKRKPGPAPPPRRPPASMGPPIYIGGNLT